MRRILLKEDMLKCTLDYVILESITWEMIKYFVILLWLCLVVIDACHSYRLMPSVFDVVRKIFLRSFRNSEAFRSQ